MASTLFSECKTLSELADEALTKVRDYCGADGATMVLREDSHCYYVDERAISPLWKGKKFPLDQCISGWAMLNGEPVVIPDIYTDKRVPIDAYRPTFVQSLCMAPIGNPAFAAIGAYWSQKLVANAEQLQLLRMIASSLEQDLKRVLSEPVVA